MCSDDWMINLCVEEHRHSSWVEAGGSTEHERERRDDEGEGVEEGREGCGEKREDGDEEEDEGEKVDGRVVDVDEQKEREKDGNKSEDEGWKSRNSWFQEIRKLMAEAAVARLLLPSSSSLC